MLKAASGVRFEEWFSDTDASLWLGERDPRLRSTIVSVWVLDRMPDDQEFEDKLAEAVEEIPRLRQKVVEDSLGIAPPRWQDDPDFDSRFHLRRLHLGGHGSLPELFALAEPIAMQAFYKDRPLWELYRVAGLEGGRAGIILKLHHAISDGVGLLKMTESMIEKERNPRSRQRRTPAEPKALRERTHSSRLLREALAKRISSERVGARRALHSAATLLGNLFSDPARTLRGARSMLESLARLLAPLREPLSPLMRERSPGRALRGFTLPLADLQAAARAAGGSVNDVFVTAVTGGLRRYHEHFGYAVDALQMMMPINMRGDDEKGKRAGNNFVPARFVVPVGTRDPQQRLATIQERVRAQRAEPALSHMDDVMNVLNRLPRPLMDQFMESMVTAIDFVTSNVPGPRRHSYSSGAKIEQMFPFGPPAGAAMNITLFSYAGNCHVGINSDRAAVREPDLLLECIQKGFVEALAIASDGS